MDNNLYIDYLNSLHNYNAQNENAYGERNIDNPYFKDVMVRVGLCDYIKENLTVKKPHMLILTGHLLVVGRNSFVEHICLLI